MAKKVLSIQAGIWWTKVALIEYGVKHPNVYEVFSFRTPEHAVEDGYIRERESLANQVRVELSKRKIQERKVIFSINSAKVVTREVTIPKVRDSQLKSIAQEQAREAFPMDISSYTIGFSKMGMIDGDPKTTLKLMLVAVPDNLLANYVSFADLCGLEIETFEYMGNCAVQFIAKNYIEDAVIVQLEERSTIVSVVKDNKLVFQRVAPHGYETTLATAIDHPVLGLRESIDAFEYLCEHNVTRERPRAELFPDSVITNPEERVNAITDAFNELKESMEYHVRIVVSALEFYQNQYKTPLRGTLHLIGDGMRIQGMARVFDTKINIEVEKNDYIGLVKMDKKIAGHSLVAGESLGMLSIFGAVLSPMNIMPKELVEKYNKRNSTRTAGMVFACSLAISAGLLLIGYVKQSSAEKEQKRLKARISELEAVNKVYDENNLYRGIAEQYRTFDNMTKTQNERLGDLITALEEKLPATSTVINLSVSEGRVTINMTCDVKMTAAQLIMNLKEIPFLDGITIPSIAQQGGEPDELGLPTETYWSYTVVASLVTPANDPDAPETVNGQAVTQ